MAYWVRFDYTGNPNGGNSTCWPTYSTTAEGYLNLDTSIVYKEEKLCTSLAFFKDLDISVPAI
jgi:carboxylesterase type B